MRELQNRVQRAVIHGRGQAGNGARTWNWPESRPRTRRRRLKEARESAEREMIQDALRRHGGRITSAALELGISRPTLYELMEKLRIARADFEG